MPVAFISHFTIPEINFKNNFFVQEIKFPMGLGGSTVEHADTVEEAGVHVLDNTHFFEFHFESAGWTILFVILVILICLFVFSLLWSLHKRCQNDDSCASCYRCCFEDAPEPYEPAFIPQYPAGGGQIAWYQQKSKPFKGQFGYNGHHLQASAASVNSTPIQNPHFFLDPRNVANNTNSIHASTISCPTTTVAAAASEVSPRFQEITTEAENLPPSLIGAGGSNDPVLEKIIATPNPVHPWTPASPFPLYDFCFLFLPLTDFIRKSHCLPITSHLGFKIFYFHFGIYRTSHRYWANFLT